MNLSRSVDRGLEKDPLPSSECECLGQVCVVHDTEKEEGEDRKAEFRNIWKPLVIGINNP